MPLISVIVPIYNVEKYLDRCVESIINQTFKDFELILVNDGSSDNCPKICDDWAKKDSRIKVIHQEYGGVSSARNTGLDNVSGEYVTFVDSDDWIYPLTFEVLYAELKENNVKISACAFVRTDGKELSVNENNLKAEIICPEEFYCQRNVNAVVIWGKLYKKECFDSIRYPLGKIHEDEYVTYQILFKEEKIAFIDEPLYAYFQNSNGIMRSEWTSKRLDVLDAFINQADFFKNQYPKAFEFVCNSYFYALESNYIQSEKDENSRKIIRKKMKYAVKHYKKKGVSKYSYGIDKIYFYCYADKPIYAFIYKVKYAIYHKVILKMRAKNNNA